MLTIVISIIIGMSLILLGRNKCNFPVYTGILIIIVGIGIGLFCPISGYDDFKEKGTLELTLFRSNDILNSEYVYAEVSDKKATYSSNGTEQKTVSGCVVTIEQARCEKPTLIIEEGKGRMSIWTFALFNSETKYVFYIPKGSILEK